MDIFIPFPYKTLEKEQSLCLIGDLALFYKSVFSFVSFLVVRTDNKSLTGFQ